MKYFKVEQQHSSNFTIYRAHNINTLVNRLYKGKRLVESYRTKDYNNKEMLVVYRRRSEWSEGIDTRYIHEIPYEHLHGQRLKSNRI